MNTKENWIEETLNALETIQSVEVPLSLKYSLLNTSKPKEIRLNTAQKWTIAASVIVLLGINLISMNQYSKKSEKLSFNEGKSAVYKEYFSSDY
jgi:hypothetical protein